MCNTISQRIIITLGVLFCVLPVAQAQLDDPTRPPGYRLVLPGGKKAAGAKTVTRYVLSSVFISSSRRTAVINDKSVGVGEYVGGAKVHAINPSSVSLVKAGQKFSIRLHSQVVKKSRIQ